MGDTQPITASDLQKMGMADVYIYCGKQSSEITRLRAEVEALRADAERYRWLKANRLGETLGDDGTLCIEFYCDFEHYNDVDAAIDKARKP